MRAPFFQHEFFRPMWRRVVCVAFCLGWGVFEYVTGEPFWAAVFVGFAGAASWSFFFAKWDSEKGD